jgi:hypothetical protein
MILHHKNGLLLNTFAGSAVFLHVFARSSVCVCTYFYLHFLVTY